MATQSSNMAEFGINLLESEIDNVLFSTNQFLTSPGNYGDQGAFWYILQISMALGALFALIMAGNMAFKMMVKHEPLDVLKLFKPLAISMVMFLWYPRDNKWCALDILAVIPNKIGSYTCSLYEAEALQVQNTFKDVLNEMQNRDVKYADLHSKATLSTKNGDPENMKVAAESGGVEETVEEQQMALQKWIQSLFAGTTIAIDELIMFLALVTFRIGWWSTIYCQQILLGALTIFGPIQWAFSLLPKWEGAWAKWIIRYLTVHFYGAMLYFVGFYVLLLFDIVMSIQKAQLTALNVDGAFATYVQDSFFTSGYMLAASIVACKCLNLVPDLAAWMVPEGDTAFSTRNFGEGVATAMSSKIQSGIGTMMKG